MYPKVGSWVKFGHPNEKKRKDGFGTLAGQVTETPDSEGSRLKGSVKVTQYLVDDKGEPAQMEWRLPVEWILGDAFAWLDDSEAISEEPRLIIAA